MHSEGDNLPRKTIGLQSTLEFPHLTAYKEATLVPVCGLELEIPFLSHSKPRCFSACLFLPHRSVVTDEVRHFYRPVLIPKVCQNSLKWDQWLHRFMERVCIQTLNQWDSHKCKTRPSWLYWVLGYIPVSHPFSLNLYSHKATPPSTAQTSDSPPYASCTSLCPILKTSLDTRCHYT